MLTYAGLTYATLLVFQATKLYCFVHKVPVCGECICFPEHEICVVNSRFFNYFTLFWFTGKFQYNDLGLHVSEWIICCIDSSSIITKVFSLQNYGNEWESHYFLIKFLVGEERACVYLLYAHIEIIERNRLNLFRKIY